MCLRLALFVVTREAGRELHVNQVRAALDLLPWLLQREQDAGRELHVNQVRAIRRQRSK